MVITDEDKPVEVVNKINQILSAKRMFITQTSENSFELMESFGLKPTDARNLPLQIKEATKLVLVYFYSKSCLISEYYSPVISALAIELEQYVDFYSVDIDEHAALALWSEFQGTPSLKLYKKTLAKDALSGMFSREKILTWLETHM